jgi:hypothetical protein
VKVLQELSSVSDTSMPCSLSRLDFQQAFIRALPDRSTAAGNSEEVATLDGFTNPFSESMNNMNTPAPGPLASYSSVPHRALPSRLPGGIPVHSDVGQASGASLPQDPMTSSRETSSQGEPTVSPDLLIGSNWWDDIPLARNLQQQSSSTDEANYDLNFSAFDSTTSFDKLFGTPIGGDLSSTWDDTPNQTHTSDEEMTAWLNAPVDWQ